MPLAWLSVAVVVAAIVAGEYQFHLKPILTVTGVIGRTMEAIGNTNCTTVPELQGCEKLVLHSPSGLVYLACSTPIERSTWVPALEILSGERTLYDDYIATYDPATSVVRRLILAGFPSGRGFSSHGMDVVPSASNPNELFIYAINHRAPLHGKAEDVGADSVVEVFKTTVGGKTATHLRTIEDPVIQTPNDVVGSSDGKSFYFTNDYGKKVGYTRTLEALALMAQSTVGFCHVDRGCKIAISGMRGNNGIAKAQNETYYVGSCMSGEVRVLERQADDLLVTTDLIRLDRVLDNLSVDDDGVLWAAGFPKVLPLISATHDPTNKICPSSALRITRNGGHGAFFGEKFDVKKVFEDDGRVASGATTVAHDARRGVLYLTGVVSPYLTICKT
ncbi:calcium-dependent phosphotriesterase [Artomyces pyxidatus]|uniref:Calcium-dependent phosphotriesterase n=1 Tax=Artomyces pyxidatus TaxID=48021 RepID=A0ACB8T488_9AGAM|nr:calcium-dependent phosphotriesterase [Artomyces pyxidatus]